MKTKLIKLRYKIFGSQAFYPLPSVDSQKKYSQTLKSSLGESTSVKTDSLHTEWVDNSNALTTTILNSDPLFFTEWKTIRETMFHVAKEPEFFSIKKSIFWKKYKDALRETKVGNPPPYPLYPTSSGNLIHHAYNLLQLLEKFPIEITNLKSIIEFGGGYGSTCRLLYTMGFKGKYTIFDVPEFLALQRYFLSMLDFYKKYTIKLTEKLDEVDQNADICIMTWSLSEVPIVLREQFLNKIGKPSYFLIAYQKDFGNVDNIQYFKNFKEKYSEYTWHEHAIPHLKANYYLVGKRNDTNN